MEYAAGGELFECICNAGRFSEDEARFFFQQLILGVSYCHPNKRITIRDISNHPWFLKNLPRELLEGANAGYPHDDYNNPPQPIDEIVKILGEAKVPPPMPKTLAPYLWDEDEEELEGAADQFDEEDSIEGLSKVAYFIVFTWLLISVVYYQTQYSSTLKTLAIAF